MEVKSLGIKVEALIPDFRGERKLKMLNYIDDQTIEKIKTEAKERIDRIFDEREKIAPPVSGFYRAF